MKSVTTLRFRKAFSALPFHVKDLTRKAFKGSHAEYDKLIASL